MPLVNCPDCGNPVSTAATACPHCGYPLAPASVEKETIVRDVPPPIEKETFPKWILIPLVIIGALVIFMLFALYRQGDDDQRNVNVNVSARRASNDSTERAANRTDNEPNQVTVPPATETNVTTATPEPQSTVTTIPPTTSDTSQGSLTLEAKVLDKTGETRPVRDEKFYLLDEDLESILRDANIEDETGQGLVNAFGLSVLYPDRYPEINQKALNAINKHIVYDATTGATGEAKISSVKPDKYYLFGITKTATGFAIWNSPVTITAGENKLNLRPQRLTEISR